MHLRLILLGCFALALLVFAAAGCGDESKSSSSLASTAALPARDGDNDIDSLGQGRYDSDNDAHPTFGIAANSTERQAIIALIKRYYAAAAAGEAAKACALLDPLLAEGIVEEHHKGEGPPSLRGNTCPQVAGKVFAQHHRELTEDIAGLHVGWVQLHAKQAVTLVHFGSKRELIVRVRRAQGVWEMDALLDNGPL